MRFAPKWQSGPDWWKSLSDFDLWFVWSGRGRMEMGDEAVSLSAGSCIWKRPGRRYVTTHSHGHPLGVNFFHFELVDECRRRAPASLLPPFEFSRIDHVDFADIMMQRILQLRREPSGEASAVRLFNALLAELTRETANRAIATSSIRAEHLERIHQAMADIRSNPGLDWTVAALAQKHGYSVSHFSRLFAGVAGKRPQEFVIEARLARARELLALSQCRIGEAAEASGFRDIYYFSRLFKIRHGLTPSAYRQQLTRS